MAEETPASPPRRKGWEALYYAIAGLLMVIVAGVNSLSREADLRSAGSPEPFWVSLTGEYTSVVALFVLLPVITWLGRRFPWTGRPVWRWLTIHALATIPFSLAHTVLMSAQRIVIYGLAHRPYGRYGDIGAAVYEYRKDILTYALTLFIYWAWREWGKPRTLVAPPGPALNLSPLEVKDGARRIFVRPSEIVWIEAAGNYAELHLADGRSLLHRSALSALEGELGSAFARIHRSRLINRAEVSELAANDAGDFTVTFRDGRTVGGSRRYRAGVIA